MKSIGLMVLLLLLIGCTNNLRHIEALTTIDVCCDSYSEFLSNESLDTLQPRKLIFDEATPHYNFKNGKSAFHTIDLPQTMSGKILEIVLEENQKIKKKRNSPQSFTPTTALFLDQDNAILSTSSSSLFQVCIKYWCPGYNARHLVIPENAKRVIVFQDAKKYLTNEIISTNKNADYKMITTVHESTEALQTNAFFIPYGSVSIRILEKDNCAVTGNLGTCQ